MSGCQQEIQNRVVTIPMQHIRIVVKFGVHTGFAIQISILFQATYRKTLNTFGIEEIST
jgi:hypothetical protein